MLSGSEWLVYEDVSEPIIEKPTDVIVRIGGAGVCGTDLELIKGVWCNRMRIELPMGSCYIIGYGEDIQKLAENVVRTAAPVGVSSSPITPLE